MAKSRIVVDGSNIATEGRSIPSLAQLESALAELRKEHPKAEVTVVVDATFAHRIDPSELKRFEDGMAKGEYITPPAGAIGRGDAFILLIAEKAKAVVLSNDSFQEFHGDHAWLFDSDRLLGASPVPGVGWIFIPRTPVRGAKSRAAVRGVRNLPPMPKPKTPPPARAKKVAGAEPAVEKKAPVSERPARHVATSVAAVNDPTTFITFIASHPLGAEIEAEVESFTSHGAIIRYQGVQCYAPLSGLGSPPPRSPREVLSRGELRTFVVRGLDPERRGIELSLPGLDAAVTGEARSFEIDDSLPATEGDRGPRKRATKQTAAKRAVVRPTKAPLPSSASEPRKRAPSKRAVAAPVAPDVVVASPRLPKKVAKKSVAPAKSVAKRQSSRVLAEAKVPAKTQATKRSAALKTTSPKRSAQEPLGASPATGKRSVEKVAPKRATKKSVAQRKSPAKRGETKTRRS
jgi:hypothetical protein